VHTERPLLIQGDVAAIGDFNSWTGNSSVSGVLITTNGCCIATQHSTVSQTLRKRSSRGRQRLEACHWSRDSRLNLKQKRGSIHASKRPIARAVAILVKTGTQMTRLAAFTSMAGRISPSVTDG
jgi:hypothetical protein